MGFENAHANMETGLAGGASAPAETPSSDLAPETSESSGSQDTAPDSASESDSPTIQELIDLDKLDKFKLHGEEWTRDKLASSMLRQADYTRKTQEFNKERKFYENLHYDLENLKKNPNLIGQFKKIYPTKFHSYVEQLEGQSRTKPAEGSPEAKLDPQILDLINEVKSIKGTFHQQEVKTAGVMLDGLIKQYSAKYPYVHESSALNMAISLMEQKKMNGETEDLSKDEWDRIYKNENDRVRGHAETNYKETVNKQLKANRKAKDIGTGGDAVGNAPKRMTMKEATEAAIRDAQNGTLR